MDDDVYLRRWMYVLEGRVEITHLLNKEGEMVGMSLETDLEIVDCFTPDEVNAAIDRLIAMESLSGSIH